MPWSCTLFRKGLDVNFESIINRLEGKIIIHYKINCTAYNIYKIVNTCTPGHVLQISYVDCKMKSQICSPKMNNIHFLYSHSHNSC